MNPHKTYWLRTSLLTTALVLPGLLPAVTIPTSFGNGADTYLTNDGNSGPTVVHGGETNMEIRTWQGVRYRVLYLRFDISGVSGDLSGATITLYANSNNRSRTFSVYGLADAPTLGGLGNNWAEGSLSYSNASGFNAAAAGEFAFNADLSASLAGLAVTQGAAGDYTSTTGTISDFLATDTDGLVTFVIAHGYDSSLQSYFQTKEAGNGLGARLNLPNATGGDTDSDGLPDAWETANGLDPNDDGTVGESSAGAKDGPNGALGDPDLDTFNNLAEFNNVPSSDPQDITSIPGDADGDDLADLWEDANFGDNDGTPTLLELGLQDGFGDPDNDKGTNEEEETAATDPNDRASFLDDDGGSPDGQNDWWEIFYFGDTSTSTAGTDDIEPDTYDNDTEYAAFSDPNDNLSIPGDIDGDGVPDLWEDRYYGNNDGIVTEADLTGTDGSANTDGDAFTDLEESNGVPLASNPFDGNSIPGESDGDGLGDQWEIDFFGNVTSNNGLHDPDGDLYTNEEEETAGTDPTDIYDFVEDSEPDGQNDRWEIQFFGDLTTSNSEDDDIDNDTFLNYEEYEAFSNPNDINSTPDDIDGDGLDDSFEITFFGDIYTYDGDDDPDRDYSTNEEEETALTDPNNRAISPDLDFDGLGDGWEIFSFTTTDAGSGGTDDPNGDNDNDTFSNAAEYAAATNGNDPLSTPDGDADGLPDGWELFHFIMAGEDPVADRAAILARQTGKDDTDAGGASNQLEFYAGTNPNDGGVDDPSPVTLTTANGNGADSTLANEDPTPPTTVNGAGNGLLFRNNAASRLSLGLLRFDVNGLGGDLSSTLLRINMTGAPRTRDMTVYGLVDGDPGENWPEATTSYSNAPGLIAADLDQRNVFARDPKKLRRLGVLSIQQNVTGIYLSDPNKLNLKSFLEDDSDGIVTLYIHDGSASGQFFTATSKEGAAANLDLAPALVAPNASFSVPAELEISSVVFDTTANTFTMSVKGLTNGASYHIESLIPPASTFSAMAGSTFTGATDPQDVMITADEATNPTQLFRISEGAEP